MNYNPIVGSSILTYGTLSTGVGNRLGTSGIYNLLYSSSTYNYRIERISIIPGGNFPGGNSQYTTRLYLSKNNGTTLRLFDEILFSAITSSTTALSARQVNFYSDLQLKSGQRILVGATTVNTNIDVFAQIGDF
jgi:hypothetical protein